MRTVEEIVKDVLEGLKVGLQEHGIDVEKIKHIPAFRTAFDELLNRRMELDKFMSICDKLLIVNPGIAYKPPAKKSTTITVDSVTTNGS